MTQATGSSFFTQAMALATANTISTVLSELLAFMGNRLGQTRANQQLAKVGHLLTLEQQYTLHETYLYGSSRLGVKNQNTILSTRVASVQNGSLTPIGNAILNTDSVFTGTAAVYGLPKAPTARVFNRTWGLKQYELSNHLGNVQVTISDKKLGVVGANQVDFIAYEPEVKSATDYYAYGMEMPGRIYNPGSYRYGGAGGQEMDNEIAGVGNSYTAEYWQYDPRLIRRWNTDPITFPWQSTYACFNNNPINFNDPYGLFGSRKEAREYKKEHNIKGRISKGDDGIFSINDSKNVVSYFKDPSLDGIENLSGRGKDGVIRAAIVIAKHLEGVIDYSIPAERESNVPLKERGRKRQQMLQQLASYNGEGKATAFDFFVANTGLTKEEITNQRADRSIIFGSQPGGPNVRYIQDPINPQAVIDLRHMLIIGEKGRFIGNSLELAQWAAGQASGCNYQDYYSNFLGYLFYQSYGSKLNNNPNNFADYVYEFLNSTQNGRLGTDGCINYYK